MLWLEIIILILLVSIGIEMGRYFPKILFKLEQIEEQMKKIQIKIAYLREDDE